MKNQLILILAICILSACNNKSEKENQEIEAKKLAIEINQIIGIGKIIPEKDIIQISSAVNGIVTKIYKKENDTVNKGTVILELDHVLEDEKLIQLQNEISTQTSQIKVDLANVSEYEAKISNAKSELQHLQNLIAKGAETQQTLDDANTNLKVLHSNLNKFKASVIVSKNRLNETSTAIKIAKIEREQKIIRSPIHGRILEMSVLIGGSVTIQQSFIQISTEGNTIAICEIDELNAEKIKVGQQGIIRNIGSADTLSKGIVFFTSSFLKKKSLFTDQSGEKEDRRVRTIKMMLDQTDNILLNTRVECVINISSYLNK